MTKSSLVITDELLMAYADNELENGLARQVEVAIASNPALAARLEVFRVTGRSLGPHFDAVLEAQPPAAMLQAIRNAPMTRPVAGPRTISFGQSIRNVLQSIGFGTSPWPALAGVAAGLLIGLVSTQWGGPAGALISEQNGKLVAAGALEKTLESTTMQASQDGSVRVVATFKDDTGRWCRLYQGAEHSGLACRAAEQRQWKILAAGEGVAGDGNLKTPSSGGGAQAVDDLAMTMMASSAALDPQAEAALIARQWKSE